MTKKVWANIVLQHTRPELIRYVRGGARSTKSEHESYLIKSPGEYVIWIKLTLVWYYIRRVDACIRIQVERRELQSEHRELWFESSEV